ncbi:MAG: SAM-dependent methyltransferase [Pseudomonadota bacterium]
MSSEPTPLEIIIKDKIRTDGPITIAEYMSLCLGHEKYGYYQSQNIIGQSGDFTTAPEISQLFGEILAAWVIDVWSKMGQPSKVHLVECGPGRGTLMDDILRIAQKYSQFYDAVHITMLETSSLLIDKQKKKLQERIVQAKIQDKVTWVHNVSMISHTEPLIILGNEFLDALPIHQYRFTDTGWKEKYIDLNKNDAFHYIEKSVKNEDLKLFPRSLLKPQLEDHLEVSHEAVNFMESLAKLMRNKQSIALFIDYGYVLPAYEATLQAVKTHRQADIFDTPGFCDLTAYVNFFHLSEIILNNNLMLFGPVSQSHFLTQLGIELRADQLIQNASTQEADEIKTALRRLIGNDTHNNEMGDLFKVIAFTNDEALKAEGFA